MAVQTAAIPTTATPFAIPPGFWQREASHNPRPLTPLGSSVFVDGVNQSFSKVFAEFGLPLETLEHREIGGYVYNTLVPLGAGKDRKPRRMPPAPVLWLALRLHPMFRKRLGRNREVLESRLDLRMVERWYDESRPRLIADTERLRAVDLASFDDAALAGHIVELKRWTWEAFDVHFMLTAPYILPLHRFARFTLEHLGYDDLDMMRLLSGLSEASSAPAVALAQLADRIRGDQSLAAAIADAPAGDVQALIRERSGDIARAYDEYVRDYAFRALRYELIEPAMDEQPEIIGQLLKEQLRKPSDLAAQLEHLTRERETATSEALAALPDDATRQRFRELLADAQRVYPVREDNEFFTISVPLAVLRRAIREAGRRLVKADVLAIEDDVYFLVMDEVVEALRKPPSGDELALLVERRRADFEAAERFVPPPSYGEEPPPPPLSVLPPHARETMEAVMYAQQKIFDQEAMSERDARPAAADEVRGRAAGSGTYTGPVRIIMGEHEFDRLQPGDVLVCPITSPVWSVLFAKVGALVTDSGGILSHPAIIAREYRIPAVVATRDGTARLRDGQQVLVDGDAGVVRMLA